MEALTAYRNSLYLACANLLGAASEGSWYAAGEKLSHLDEPLGKAIDSDDTARVIKRVADVLRQHGRLKITVDELLAQASLLRQLRNYGAHPRGNETDHLERYFSESGGAILLMETYTYLTRLADAVESRLEVAQSEDK